MFNLLQLVTIATFQLQVLKLDLVSSTYHLNFICMNALGVNKPCEIKARVETKRSICKFTVSPEKEAQCALPKHLAVMILVMAYDEA